MTPRDVVEWVGAVVVVLLAVGVVLPIALYALAGAIREVRKAVTGPPPEPVVRGGERPKDGTP